jgi:hypothetical protein
MSSLTSTEKKIAKETNNQIVSEIVERALDGELLNVKNMMKKWGMSTRDYEATTRMTNLFNNYAKNELAEQGYMFRCIHTAPDWLWGIVDTQEKMKSVFESTFANVRGRLKMFNKIKKDAIQLGYKSTNMTFLLEEGNNDPNAN